MLKITVHNAERIPNLERFTSVDPLVTLIFQGKVPPLNFAERRL